VFHALKERFVIGYVSLRRTNSRNLHSDYNLKCLGFVSY